MVATFTDDLVISGWSAASAFGLGADPFIEGLRAGRNAVGELDRDAWPVPFDRAGLIPGFDIIDVLGRKGTRSMDRVTGIAVTVVGMLLDRYGPGITERPERVGLVLGTTSGSVQSIIDFTCESLTGEKPFHVDPARFPNTVMNRPAGQSAIWYQLRGPNTTIAGGALTSLLALNYAARLHRRGRAEVILCGAVEEFSTHRAWLEWHSQQDMVLPGDEPPPLGEGGVIFVVEPASGARRCGREPLAAVLAARFLASETAAGIRPALARCITDTLDRAGACPGEVRLVAASDVGGPLGEQEDAAIAEALGGASERVGCRPLIGDTAAAAGAFQLAAVLTAAPGAARGELALVLSVDRDGGVGCVLLRVGPDPAGPS